MAYEERFPGRVDDFGCECVQVVERLYPPYLGEQPVNETEISACNSGDGRAVVFEMYGTPAHGHGQPCKPGQWTRENDIVIVSKSVVFSILEDPAAHCVAVLLEFFAEPFLEVRFLERPDRSSTPVSPRPCRRRPAMTAGSGPQRRPGRCPPRPSDYESNDMDPR